MVRTTVPRDQYEYKLKAAVENIGEKPLDIGREHFVLLWKTLDPNEWSPPQGGEPAPPQRLRYQGRDVWAVSANLDGVAEPITNAYGTFATHWVDRTLAPGESSFQLSPASREIEMVRTDGSVKRIRFNENEDDLVFYVPAAAVNTRNNFLGLGYLAGDRILAVCPQERWGPRVPPGLWTAR